MKLLKNIFAEYCSIVFRCLAALLKLTEHYCTGIDRH